MSGKLVLDAAVSHLNDALKQEGDDIHVSREVLSTILVALTQSVKTENTLTQIKKDFCFLRCDLERYREADNLVAEGLYEARKSITAISRNKFSDPLVQSRKVPAHVQHGSQTSTAGVPDECIQARSYEELYPLSNGNDDTIEASYILDSELDEVTQNLDVFAPFHNQTMAKDTHIQQENIEHIKGPVINPRTKVHLVSESKGTASSDGFYKPIAIRASDELTRLKESIDFIVPMLQQIFGLCTSARKAAESAYHSRSELLATMSHEIRTPIHGIIGMAHIGLEAEGLPFTAREPLNMVYSLGKNLLTTINNILDLSRIEASRMAVENVPFDLGLTVLNTLKPFAAEASKKKTDITYKVGSYVPQHAIGDPSRLCQVLFNLVGNAVKFTKHGEIELSIRAILQQTCAQNECIVEFSIADTGIGIKENQLDLIFGEFQQGDNSVVNQFGGTGLGLAICKRLVNLMGGHIWVKSAVGMGSIFSFTWPLKLDGLPTSESKWMRPSEDLTVYYIAASRPENNTLCQILTELGIHLHVFDEHDMKNQNYLPDVLIVETSETAYAVRACDDFGSTPLILFNPIPSDSFKISIRSVFDLGIVSYITSPCSALDVQCSLFSALQDCPRPSNAKQTTPLSILIAEDNDICQQVAVKALEKCTSDITVVTNGLEAFQEYQRRRFDVIVMDIQMPVMDGRAAASKIRAYERVHNSKHTPIIGVSADAMAVDDPLEAGMDEYVSKPLKPTQLLDVIFSCHLRGARTQAAGDNVDRDSACEI
ncbi:hypothetical protein BDV23DRAFT_185830 [Aspergillus alliaceus]|uniref:Histidine kinase n=1 Tax=Petromyces alliaceus TaxID=209559 RepID=A0A5N7C266_PETAA|nr:hypothetical protein BDV23DRAFT_185830 [Aspergillus alliaceus]